MPLTFLWLQWKEVQPNGLQTQALVSVSHKLCWKIQGMYIRVYYVRTEGGKFYRVLSTEPMPS